MDYLTEKRFFITLMETQFKNKELGYYYEADSNVPDEYFKSVIVHITDQKGFIESVLPRFKSLESIFSLIESPKNVVKKEPNWNESGFSYYYDVPCVILNPRD